MPDKSACPGRGAVTRADSTGSPHVDITSVQLSQSRFPMLSAIGVPSVRPNLMPDSTAALSVSIFIRPPRP
jgi:hypothetical protein